MKIQDRRSEEAPNVFRFDQLEQGWTVEGVETGQIYYVVRDPGFPESKRLVNLNKEVLQNPRHCGGKYRRIFNARLVLPPQPER
jgi:hypothetical protein